MRILIGALLCILAIFVTSSGKAENDIAVAGGWSEASPDNKDITDAARFAVTAQAAVMKAEDKKDAALSLVQVLNAGEQVVAGMNYKLVLKVEADGVEREAEAVVWKQLSGDYQLTSWTWRKD